MKQFKENSKGKKTFEDGTELSDGQVVRLVENSEIFNNYLENIYKNIKKGSIFAYTINMSNTCPQKPINNKGFEASNTKTTNFSTISEFVELVLNQKRTWSPYIFDGFGLTKDNSIFSQIIALDFDSGVTFENVLNCCKFYEIPPTFMHTSFSHTEEHHKFRAIWFLNDLISLTNDNYPFESQLKSYQFAEKTLAKFIDNILSEFVENKTLYPTVYDVKCVGDIQRKFYSGTKLLYLNENNIYTEQDFHYLLGAPAMTLDGGRPRNAGNFLEERAEDFNGGEYLQNTQFTFEELANRFQIFNDFVNCKWLSWGVLRGIASNLAYFKGGCKFFLNKIEEIQEKGFSKYNQKDYNNIKNLGSFLTKVRKKGWFPESLNKFSPYETDHQYNNMTEKIRKNNVIIPRTTETVEKYNHLEAIDKAKKETTDFFERIGQRYYKEQVILYTGSCGIGKTYTAAEFAARAFELYGMNCSISFKRYNVIEEKYKLTQTDPNFSGCDFIAQPKMPDFSFSLKQKIENLYREKEFLKVSELIREVSNTTKGKKSKFLSTDIDMAAEYQKLIDIFEDADRSLYKNYTALCTHKRTINKPLKSDILIMDECIEPACYNQTEISLETLTNFKNNLHIKYHIDYQAFVNSLTNKLTNCKSYTDKFDISFVRLLKKCKSFCKENKLRNLYDFFNCETFTIYEAIYEGVAKIIIIGAWYKVPTLKDDQQMIVISATPNIDFYISKYGVENVRIVNQETDVKFGATVYQNTNYSYAKSSLNNFENNVEENNNKLKETQTRMLVNLKNCLNQYKDDKPILITYKDFEKNKKFKQFADVFVENNIKTDINGEIYYFGNLDGMDGAKHKSTLIFGTYSNNPDSLKRKCILIYPNVDIVKMNADKTKKQECSDIDFEKFVYNTYTVEELRNQHLYFTRDAQLQALYRSRPITADKNCIVFMLSKYPIKGATIFNRF